MVLKIKGRVVAPELDTLSRVGLSLQAPGSSEDVTLIAASNVQRTITKVSVVLRGSSSPSITWTLRHGSDRSGAGTEVVTGGTTTINTTTGEVILSFDSATILKDEHLWLAISASAGTVNEFGITVYMVDQ